MIDWVDWPDKTHSDAEAADYHRQFEALTEDAHGHIVCVCAWCQGVVGPDGPCPVAMETHMGRELQP